MLKNSGFIGIYIFILLIVHFTHAAVFEVDVVFYSSLLDAGLASLTYVFVLYFLYSIRSVERLFYLAVFSLSLGFIFAISVPTVIDRSLSFYIIEKVRNNGGEADIGFLRKEFFTLYSNEYRVMDIRITEQKESGMIIQDGNCIKLTRRGEMVAAFSQLYRENMLPKIRKIGSTYSDDLARRTGAEEKWQGC